MKHIDIDEVWSSRLLYEKPYTILYYKSEATIFKKLLAENPLFEIPKNTILCCRKKNVGKA